MISTYLAMQNAISAQNVAQSSLIGSTTAMFSTTAFGNSQPLRPQFGSGADVFELQNKGLETRVSALQSLINSIEKSIAKSIGRSTPKYAGVNCIA